MGLQDLVRIAPGVYYLLFIQKSFVSNLENFASVHQQKIYISTMSQVQVQANTNTNINTNTNTDELASTQPVSMSTSTMDLSGLVNLLFTMK